MQTYYFKFPTDEAFANSAHALGFTTNDDLGRLVISAYTEDYSIDDIGTLYNTDGTVISGYHINYQGTIPTEWEEYQIYPENPQRHWL